MVKLDLMAAEEFPEFVLKCFDAVMRFLFFDVTLHLCSAFEAPTEKAAYPFCQENEATPNSWRLISLEDSTFMASTSPAIVVVRPNRHRRGCGRKHRRQLAPDQSILQQCADEIGMRFLSQDFVFE